MRNIIKLNDLNIILLVLNTMDIEKIKINPEKYAKHANISDLEKLIELATKKYYTDKTPLISDYVYDILIDGIEQRDPSNPVLKKIGVSLQDEKVKLPYFMGSMNKIKTKDAVKTWISKYKTDSEFVISDKLDGISALYDCRNSGSPRLFTRGNGEYGKCITHLLDILGLPKLKGVVLRGELIVSKKNFEANRGTYISSRSMVNGFVSKKEQIGPEAKVLDFVIFEVIEPVLTPLQQFQLLEKHKFKIPNYQLHSYKDIVSWESDKDNFLTNKLNEFKISGKYDIDGIIITHNKYYERTSGNPKNSIAFKSNNYGKVTTVKDIVWEASKYGVLIPRIQFEKIDLGSNVEFCTGFSGKFIYNNCLGPGSVIRVVLSGDVIPFIVEIIKKTYPKMPDTGYKWTTNDLHCIAIDNTESITKKQILYFVKTIGIEYLSVGLINKLYENGFKTINQVLGVKKSDLLELDGFKETLANKIIDSINRIVSKPIYLGLLMVGSLKFNSGFGIKKIDKILEKYPNILTQHISVERITEIDGFHVKTATQFLDNLDNFKSFLKTVDLKYYIKPKKADNSLSAKQKHAMINGKFIVMTGFRDKVLVDFIEQNGGTIQNDVNMKTNYVIVKDLSSTSSKVKKAKIIGSSIVSLEEFKSML